MENISENLMMKLTKLTELEAAVLKIKSAIFVRNINEKLETSLNEIELRLDEEIEYYNQKPGSYIDYKNKIKQKYNEEFMKIVDEYELQFINICEEIQETYANQKIAIANCKKIKNLKDKFLSSEKYIEYKKIKIKYKEDMDNSLTKVEFDKNMNLLKNLENPEEKYQDQIIANLQKAKDYEEIIQKCVNKMDECTQDCMSELSKFVLRKTSQLQIYNKVNIFIKLFNKMTNIWSGRKKVQINIIDKSDFELQNLETQTVNSIENTRTNTIGFIEQLLNLRENVKNKGV